MLLSQSVDLLYAKISPQLQTKRKGLTNLHKPVPWRFSFPPLGSNKRLREHGAGIGLRREQPTTVSELAEFDLLANIIGRYPL